MICQDLEWMTLSTIAKKVQSMFLSVTVMQVQSMFPSVTVMQVHTTWTTMSEILWKRDQLQLPSATILLKENYEDVEVFDNLITDNIEELHGE